jgi:hypothetical protein
VQAALSQLTALLDEEQRAKEEAAQKEAIRKRRLEENKARQQAILAKFAAKQKEFIETTKQGSADEEGEQEADTGVPVASIVGVAGAESSESLNQTTSSDLVCVLCKVSSSLPALRLVCEVHL